MSAGRSFLGRVITWFLLGGSIFTAHTFAAVSGPVFAAGGIGFFPFVYAVVSDLASEPSGTARPSPRAREGVR